jgi:hypothetical protein
MNQLSRISPISDAEAARTVRASTLADLAGQITATEQMADSRSSSLRARRRPLRLALIGTPVVAGLAIAAVILAAGPAPVKAGHPGQPADGTARLTAALSFATSGGYITVKVVNPLADASRYRAEFAQHHLKITLNLVPASPSIVGTLVYFSESTGDDITPITARGKCFTGGGGSACPVGVRIPDGFRGQAEIVFGRAAKPGEQYESTASATAPGEVMHGMTVNGLTVTQVRAMLRQRHVTVPVYHYNGQGVGKLLRRVPGTWYVYDALPWASGQVMLFVGPTWPQSAASPPSPGSPIPSPTAGG